MPAATPQATPPLDAGLCAACAHARLVPSARGSVFVLCGLSRVDARFARYPPLPVVRCAGYRRTGDAEEAAQDAPGAG